MFEACVGKANNHVLFLFFLHINCTPVRHRTRAVVLRYRQLVTAHGRSLALAAAKRAPALAAHYREAAAAAARAAAAERAEVAAMEAAAARARNADQPLDDHEQVTPQ